MLRRALGLSPADDNLSLDEVDWQALLTLAGQQGTAALIYDQLLQLPENQRPPKPLQMQMKMVCAQSMMAQEQQRAVLRKAFAALQDCGITPVVLKGLSLARHYPKPYLRPCSDIDIYVGKEAYHQGAKVLREAFPQAAVFDEEKDYYKHYNLTLDTTAIEMHRVSAVFAHPRDNRHYDALEQDGLRTRFVPFADGEDTWNEPSPDFNILFVFVHSWEHFVGESANIRQLCDLALLIRRSVLSGQQSAVSRYLESNLKMLHLLYAWQLYAYILVHYIGLPQEQCPLYTPACADRAERLLSQILHPAPKTTDQRLSTNDSVPKNVILRKLYTLRERIRDARVLAKIEPHYARYMVATAFAQSWSRFLAGENTRKWE